MSISLAQAIHRDSDDRFYVLRLIKSTKSIFQKRGWLTGSAVVGSLTVAQITSLALSYFLIEGSVRSVMEVMNEPDKKPPVRYRPSGDVGGWTSLAIFTGLVMKNLYDRTIKEGEYIRLKKVCIEWIKDNRGVIVEDPKFREELYSKIIDLLDIYNSKCLFSKSLASRRLVALKIYEETGSNENNIQFREDKRLENIFRSIKTEIQKQTSPFNYFSRLHQGQKSVYNHGCTRFIAAQIFGIALPIILLSNVCLSLFGEYGLGKELFVDREELTDVGHFGEWPINAIDALVVACFLHLWFVIYEGDFEITKEIYANEISKLRNTPNLRNRLCGVANEELKQIANGGDYFRLPLDYEFSKTYDV